MAGPEEDDDEPPSAPAPLPSPLLPRVCVQLFGRQGWNALGQGVVHVRVIGVVLGIERPAVSSVVLVKLSEDELIEVVLVVLLILAHERPRVDVVLLYHLSQVHQHILMHMRRLPRVRQTAGARCV